MSTPTTVYGRNRTTDDEVGGNAIYNSPTPRVLVEYKRHKGPPLLQDI